VTCGVGAESDAGPSSPRARGGRQEHQGVVHQSAQDQGHLPHAEHVQPRRDAEVPHQRMLVSRKRPREDPDGTAPRNCTTDSSYHSCSTSNRPSGNVAFSGLTHLRAVK